MNKHLSKIIVSFLALVIFLAPITPALQSQSGHLAVDTKINKVEAAIGLAYSFTSNDLYLNAIGLTPNNSYIFEVDDGTKYYDQISTGLGATDTTLSTSFTDFKLNSTPGTHTASIVNAKNLSVVLSSVSFTITAPVNLPLYEIRITPSNPSVTIGATQQFTAATLDQNGSPVTAAVSWTSSDNTIGTISSTGLFTAVSAGATTISVTSGTFSASSTVTVSATSTPTPTTPTQDDSNINFGCGYWPGTWFTNCLASTFYYIIFKPISYFTHLAAIILDFFVYYSTNSTSYSSGFVSKGWGAVRDIANIFFIIALLYVAIKTILSLNTSDNKKLITYIVIIALLINFSLFFTEVIIDASNILAKVFYNNITPIDQNGTGLKDNNVGGQKSISVGLVKQFNPFTIIGKQDVKDDIGNFVFITLLCIALMVFMIYIFLSVALLFVGRVIALWLCMIFSPIAFISYTVPFKIPGFGHEEWWSELLKNAFLAPIFIFFLYLIIMFGDAMKLIPNDVASSGSWTDSVMKTVIPFMIIFVLLMKAKELAVTYAGEMGKALMSAGKMVGGLALGVATGGAAMLGRSTIGYGLSRMEKSGWVNNMAGSKSKFKSFIGNKIKNVGQAGGKGSFDFRGISIGGKSLADTGLKVGKAKEGGYEKDRKDKVQKKQKRADELKVHEDEKEKQDLNEAEMQLQGLLNKVAKDFAYLDKQIENQRAIKNDAAVDSNDYNNAVLELKNLNAKKAAIKKGENEAKVFVGTTNANGKFEIVDSGTTTRDNVTQDAIVKRNGVDTSIRDFNNDVIPELKATLETLSRERTTNYANNQRTWYSGPANREAQHKIIMEDKLDGGGK